MESSQYPTIEELLEETGLKAQVSNRGWWLLVTFENEEARKRGETAMRAADHLSIHPGSTGDACLVQYTRALSPSPKPASTTPQCDKLAQVGDGVRFLRGFYEWLTEQGIRLASYHSHGEKPDWDGEENESHGCWVWRDYSCTDSPRAIWTPACVCKEGDFEQVLRTLDSLVYEFLDIDEKALEK